MQTDLFFFIGVFAFIFVVWVATGGPERPISFSGPYLYPIQTTGVKATSYGTGRAVDVSVKTGSIGSQLKDAQTSLEELKKQVADTKTWGEISTYRGQVTIEHNTSGPSETDPQKEYVTIRLSSSASKDVSITNWKLQSASTGQEATIGDGSKRVYSGRINQDAPITLTPGDSAIIETGSSPIGDSFKENICSGYLQEFQQFAPSFQNNCPSPADEFKFYEGTNVKQGDQCYAYLQTLPRCKLQTNVSSDISSSCRNVVNDYLNYNGCVASHQNDANFYGTNWRIFLSQSKELWRTAHETIKLLDSNGRTVDVFAY